MRPSQAFQSHRDAVRELVLRHRVCNVRVFGSVLHGDDTDASDLDLLVDPTPETTLMDIRCEPRKVRSTEASSTR